MDGENLRGSSYVWNASAVRAPPPGKFKWLDEKKHGSGVTFVEPEFSEAPGKDGGIVDYTLLPRVIEDAKVFQKHEKRNKLHAQDNLITKIYDYENHVMAYDVITSDEKDPHVLNWQCDLCERTPKTYTGKEQAWVKLRYHCRKCHVSCCTDCMPSWRDKRGTVLYQHTGAAYVGEFHCGDKQGQGSLRYLNGQTYDGAFFGDKFNGYGSLIYGRGRRYDGEFKDGLRHGKGTCVFSHPDKPWLHGDVHEGMWAYDLRNGPGICAYVNGDRYEGEYKDDYIHGQGIMKFSNGNVYNGSWQFDKRNGHGEQIWVNGDKYKGQWKENRRKGQGTLQATDGTVYTGEWHRNMRHGHGKEEAPNGDVYEGQFKKDHLHGKGKYTMGNGDVYDGEYVTSIRCGRGVFTYADNTGVYDGYWDNNLYNGYGSFKYGNGDYYEGQYVDGKMHGRGVFIFAEAQGGGVYVGDFRNDKIHGNGTMYSDEINGHVHYCGRWEENNALHYVEVGADVKSITGTGSVSTRKATLDQGSLTSSMSSGKTNQHSIYDYDPRKDK